MKYPAIANTDPCLQPIQNVACNPPFSTAEMISKANFIQVHPLNFYLALLFCKADFKLLCNSTGAILVGM
jgi:hypothetical protein